MITGDGLKESLNAIFFGSIDYSDYIVPLSGYSFAPTVDRELDIPSWIGYRILDHKPNVRTFAGEDIKITNLTTRFRLGFLGPQAEDMATSTIWWDERLDVKEEFEKMNAQIFYTERRIYTHIFQQEGFNDILIWVVDFTAANFASVPTEYRPWLPLF